MKSSHFRARTTDALAQYLALNSRMSRIGRVSRVSFFPRFVSFMSGISKWREGSIRVLDPDAHARRSLNFVPSVADHRSPHVHQRQRGGDVSFASRENFTDTPRGGRFLPGATNPAAPRSLPRRRSQFIPRRNRRSDAATSAELSEATADLSGEQADDLESILVGTIEISWRVIRSRLKFNSTDQVPHILARCETVYSLTF